MYSVSPAGVQRTAYAGWGLVISPKRLIQNQLVQGQLRNSARSQMAEAWLNHLCADRFEAYSAGLEAGSLNTLVVQVMKEAGIDISHNKAKSVFDFFKAGDFSYVITVCDELSAERCPVFPGVTNRLHWSFYDPSALTGSQEEKVAAIRKIRDDSKLPPTLSVAF